MTKVFPHFTTDYFLCSFIFFSWGIKHEKVRGEVVVNTFYRLCLYGCSLYSLECLWCIPTASRCCCYHWWLQMQFRNKYTLKNTTYRRGIRMSTRPQNELKLPHRPTFLLFNPGRVHHDRHLRVTACVVGGSSLISLAASYFLCASVLHIQREVMIKIDLVDVHWSLWSSATHLV